MAPWRRGAELLFQVFTERGEGIHRSRFQRGVLRVGPHFTDPRLCAAIVDRFAFDAHIIETGTESYRLKTTRKRQEKPTAANTD